jgi:hypothetical protein
VYGPALVTAAMAVGEDAIGMPWAMRVGSEMVLLQRSADVS